MTGNLRINLMLVAILLVGVFAVSCAAAEEPTPTATTATIVATPDPDTLPEVAPPMPEDTGTPKKGGILLLATKGLGQSHFDVYQFDGTGPTGFFTGRIYNLLVRSDRYDIGVVHPELAESWDVSADGRTLTFKLRQGVKWHDGKPLIAGDVVATYRFAKDPPEGMSSKRKGDFRAVESIEAPNDSTVVIKMKRRQPDFLANLGSAKMPIYPKHLLEPALAEGKGMKFIIVGTGPYKVKDYEADIRWEAERYDDYWRPDQVYMDGFKVTYIKEEALHLAAFVTGRLHIAGFEQEASRREARKDPEAAWVTVSRANINSLVLAVDNPIFDDVRVRKAVALSLQDKRAFRADVSKLTDFTAIGAGFTPGSLWALPVERLKKIPGYDWDGDHDAARLEASQLMTAAGFPDGLEFSITANTTNEMMQPTILIQQMLNKGPFNAKIDLMEYAKYYDVLNSGGNVANVHSMTMKNVTVDGVLGECCTSAGRRNFGRYLDTELDELFDLQSQEADQGNRRELVFQYQEKWLGQYYHIQMAWGSSTLFWKKAVHGYWPAVNPSNNSWLENVWLSL